MRWSGLAIRDAVTLERERSRRATSSSCIEPKPVSLSTFLCPHMSRNCFDQFQTLIRGTSSGQEMEIPRQLKRAGRAACVACSKAQTSVSRTELPKPCCWNYWPFGSSACRSLERLRPAAFRLSIPASGADVSAHWPLAKTPASQHEIRTGYDGRFARGQCHFAWAGRS